MASIAVGLCAAPLNGAAAAEDGAALLAKHKAYVGWQDGDGAITSLRESGNVTFDARPVASIAAFHRGPLFHRVYAAGAGKIVYDGFTGRVLWSSNQNGFTVQTVGEPAKYVFTRSAVFDERLTTFPATVVRSETLDGTAVTWVRVEPGLGVPAELAVDAATGAIKRVVLDPNGKYETKLDVLAYTDVGGGKRVISSWRYTGERSIWSYTTTR